MNFAETLDIGYARAPEAEAIRLDENSLSYRELRTNARRVAGLLTGCGLRRGGKVGVLLHNAIEFAEIGFGAVSAGGVLFADQSTPRRR